MAKDKSKSRPTRRGRSLKVAEEQELKVEEVAMMAAEEVIEKKSRGKGKDEKGSRRSRKSKSSRKEVAMMAEGDNDMSVDNNNTAESEAIDKAVESGQFNSEYLTNVDADDKKRLEEKAFKQTSVNARGRMHDCLDDVEIMSDLMMTDALMNKSARARVLGARTKLLKTLWVYRDTADCEDDYNNDEFHANMRVLATIQRKLSGLDGKIGRVMLGAEQSSSDSSGNGEAADLKKLKTARQNLRYATHAGQFPA